MKKKEGIKFDVTLEIDGKFGSEFQRDSATEALQLILVSWINFYEIRHKKNKITIWADGKDFKVDLFG